MSLTSKVKIRVHIAEFLNDSSKMTYFFINIRNNFKRQYIKIRSVEFLIPHKNHYECLPIDGEGMKPLPVTVLPRNEWETYIRVTKVDEMAGNNDVLVTLTNGRRLISKKRKNVAPSGEVPNGSLEKS